MKHLYNKISGRELRARLAESDTRRITLSFYRYFHISDVQAFRDELYVEFSKLGILGRIYIAKEGINGQISVPEENLEKFKSLCCGMDALENCRLNFAIEDNGKSFFKLIIKCKHKIVADGLDDSSFDVTDRGKHLSAIEFNELASSEDTLIVDMRNHYESEVGHFKNAICPNVETFRESLPVVEEILKPYKDKNILMYCTGGIRCEKASAYYKHKGFKNVHQLEGGIIEYTRQVEKLGIENKFIGKNFVFDERLGERITRDIIATCHQCGNPCDTHTNCANDACHILFIQCDNCRESYSSCCSVKCKEFNELEEATREKWKTRIRFNGTKNVKSKLDAGKIAEHLVLIDEL